MTVLKKPYSTAFITEIIFGILIPSILSDNLQPEIVSPSAILLVYWPEKIRTTMYTHLALVFSFHIAAIVGLAFQQLTKNDAIFVVVMVASPTSIYVWLTSLLFLWKSSLFPD